MIATVRRWGLLLTSVVWGTACAGCLAAPSETGPCEDWEPTPRYFDPCDIPEPTGAIVLSGSWTLNTDTGEFEGPEVLDPVPASVVLTQNGNVPMRVVSVARFTLNGELTVTGDSALTLAAWAGADIAGQLFVNSQADRTGPGASPVCALPPAPGVISIDMEGGAGGGGNAGPGGSGGEGDTDNDQTSLLGGSAGGAREPTVVSGGCSGAAGGLAGSGAGGAGGGAVYVASAGPITISGTVHAGGLGGGGGGDDAVPNEAGGGGGGAGGLIGLDSSVVELRQGAVLAANGGGRGAGAALSLC
jgi:hypothetical protein